MVQESGRRGRRSPIGAIVLIVIGMVFLVAHFVPNADPWLLFARYWPLILILVGLGKLVDYLWANSHPDQPAQSFGVMAGLVILAVLLIIGLMHPPVFGQRSHMSREVDAQGAQSVQAHIEMPAGSLELSSGAPSLFDGEFDYTGASAAPNVKYNVASSHGDLEVTARGTHEHFATTSSEDDWNLRLNPALPTELSIEMGAGTGNLRLSDLNLTGLTVHFGAGTLNLDLNGAWKKSFHADVQGGVGTATVKLPKDVGVRVHASGGIGTINAGGLKRDGGDYVNEALGKSPVTLDLSVEGGVGTINLEEAQ